MLAGSARQGSHDFLPGIELKGRFVTGDMDGPALAFGDEGILMTPCTMVLFWTEAPQSLRRIILSAGGRARVERR